MYAENETTIVVINSNQTTTATITTLLGTGQPGDTSTQSCTHNYEMVLK